MQFGRESEHFGVFLWLVQEEKRSPEEWSVFVRNDFKGLQATDIL